MRSYGLTNVAPYEVAPAIGAAGDLYWNTAQKSLYGSDGITWNAVGASAMNGLPAGGTAGQFLVKSSSAIDYAAQWDPRQWSIGGGDTTLTPFDPTKALAVPGPAAGAQLVLGPVGAGTTKGRIRQWAGDALELSINRTDEDGQDDATKPSWGISVSTGDALTLIRKPAGGSWEYPLQIDGYGRMNVSLPTTNTTYDVLTGKYGAIACRAHFVVNPNGQASVRSNIGWLGSPDDTAQPQWAMNVGFVDSFHVQRSPAGSVPSWLTLLNLTNTGALTTTGIVKAGSGGGTGWSQLDRGDGTYPGYVAFYHPNASRVGYFGLSSGTKTIWQAEASWGIALSTGNGSFDFYGTDSNLFMRGNNRAAMWFRPNNAFVWYADADNPIRVWGNVMGDFMQCYNQNPAYVNFDRETVNLRGHRMRMDFYPSGTYYLNETHESLVGNCDSGAVLFWLPLASTCTGRTYYFTRYRGDGGSAAGTYVTIKCQGSDTIQGDGQIQLQQNMAKTVLMSAGGYGWAWHRIM